MTQAEWPETFEKLLRQHLPLLNAQTPLTSELSLAALGLDSLATVGLLIDVEESFGVQFPDDDLTAEAFETPAALWAVVKRLRTEAEE